MKNKLKFAFIIIVIAFTFLVSGIYIGKYVFDNKDVDNEIINDNVNNNTGDSIDENENNDSSYGNTNDIVDDNNIDANIDIDVDVNNESVVLTLGKYLYFLAEAFRFNCTSPYFELTWDRNTDNGMTKIYLDNYYELINKFTDEYIKNNEIMFNNTCHEKNDNNKVDISGCWCGSGSPFGVYSNLDEFEITSINNDEIVYSIVINAYNNDSNELINTYNDSFKIRKIDNEWKIDNYTYRYISNITFRG